MLKRIFVAGLLHWGWRKKVFARYLIGIKKDIHHTENKALEKIYMEEVYLTNLINGDK